MTELETKTHSASAALPSRALLLSALVLAALAPPATAVAEETIYAFPGSGVNGCYPNGTLLRDAAGALYGTTLACGGSIAGSDGTLFKLTPPAPGHTNWTFSRVVRFGSLSGKNPNADLVMDGGGALYGTTLGGGANDQGIVFKLTPPAAGMTLWTETTLHAFDYYPEYNILDGQGPGAGVIRDASGALYGTTTSGGSATNLTGFGIVFKLTPPAPGAANWTETILYRFKGGADGDAPHEALTLGAEGALYGTTRGGGTGTCPDPFEGTVDRCGTVFKLTPPAAGQTLWTKATLHIFTGGTDGGSPRAKLLLDASGALYGTTTLGGTGQCKLDPYYGPVIGCGTVFELTPPAAGRTTWTESVLYDFKGAPDGAYPEGGLSADGSGSLYGTAWQGGSGGCPDGNGLVAGCGVVFKLAPPSAGQTTWTRTLLYSFKSSSADGVHPVGGLVPGAGHLFGTTLYGPINTELGAVFETTP